jgi:hypothetical protein
MGMFTSELSFQVIYSSLVPPRGSACIQARSWVSGEDVLTNCEILRWRYDLTLYSIYQQTIQDLQYHIYVRLFLFMLFLKPLQWENLPISIFDITNLCLIIKHEEYQTTKLQKLSRAR